MQMCHMFTCLGGVSTRVEEIIDVSGVSLCFFRRTWWKKKSLRSLGGSSKKGQLLSEDLKNASLYVLFP